ncbi:MAG: NBR1-Ig-like domain-containing protein [Candidatus Saccharibacteria bacterium]|nr:NBR1-Ig-like domain-containing protein [Candidatus Saccharibacteria bacterium]
MFKKLLSNLPFNPSLIGQVSFYAKRLRSEEKLRRVGISLVALSVVIQMFAVFIPPEPTLAQSGNDIIRGGFSNTHEATLMCLDSTRDFGAILNHFGFNCNHIGNAQTVSLKSTSVIDGKELYSMGRHARGPIGRSNKNTDERSVRINNDTFYIRRLASLDTWASSTYPALRLQNSQGKVMYIIKDCGNPVLIGVPPPPPEVVDKGVCEVTSYPASVKRGERFSATVRVSNSGDTTWDPEENYRLGSQNPQDNWNWGTNRIDLPRRVSPGSSLDITESFTAPSSAGTHQFSWKMIQEGVRWFGESCSKPIVVTAPEPEPEEPDEPELTQEPEPKDVCPELPDAQDDIASCLELGKTASNITQNVADANNTTAAAGDVIEYTLLVTNESTKTLSDFVFEEPLHDVLEYADIIKQGDAEFDENYQTLRWPEADIEPGATEEKVFRVRIKDPIPQTPVSVSDPNSYDLVMTNVFHGVTINIRLPGGVVKTTEQVATTLPNTGPGTNLAVAFGITVIVSYFFARTRLMSKEVAIVRTDYASSGSAS